MKLENGNIVLSAVEIELLSLITMQQIDPQYQVEEFLGSMASIKAESQEFIRVKQSKPDFNERDTLEIGVTQAVIEVCEMLSEGAYDTVKEAGYVIKWQ